MKDNFTKTSQVFKHCYKLIDNGSVDFICHAIYDAAFGEEWFTALVMSTQKLTGKPLVAREHIRALLGNAFSLETWLENNTTNYYSLQDTHGRLFVAEKMRETRLAWLESLIEEFEAKGD